MKGHYLFNSIIIEVKKVKNIYQEEWNVFKQDYRLTFFILMGISIAMALFTYFGLVNQPELANEVFRQLSKQFEKAGAFDNVSSFGLFVFLLKNNLRAVLVTVLLGLVPVIFLAGLSSIATTGSVGIMLAMTKIQGGDAGLLFLTGIVPHGIVELPAIFLAGSIGIYLSIQTFKKLFSSHRFEMNYKQVLKQTTRSFLFVVVPMIVIAAVIEAFITPTIIMRFF